VKWHWPVSLEHLNIGHRYFVADLGLSNLKLRSILSAGPTTYGIYAFVVVRFVVAAFWLNAEIPRMIALAAGNPPTNGLVRTLFGPSMALPLSVFFYLLETLGAISYLLGFGTRLAAVWGVIEFAITGTFTGLLATPYNNGQAKDYALMAASLVLLLNGSPKLSLDGWIAKRASK